MDISILTAIKAGQLILAAANFYQNEKLDELKYDLEELKDIDLKSAISFVEIAKLCVTEEEASNNLNHAYACYVKATNAYIESGLIEFLAEASNYSVRKGINTALGNNWLSRKITGVKKKQKEIENKEQEEKKLRQAYRGVATFALTKKEYCVSLMYFDKALFITKKNIELLEKILKIVDGILVFKDIRNHYIVRGLLRVFFNNIREEMLCIKTIAKDNSIDVSTICPNYEHIMKCEIYKEMHQEYIRKIEMQKKSHETAIIT